MTNTIPIQIDLTEVMPTLNRYTESSERRGYYIRANVGGNRPITLQVSDLAGRLFELLNYTPPETVPSKLVWNMYEIGLLYTLTSLEKGGQGAGPTKPQRVLDSMDLDSSLSPDEEEEIITQLESYEGPEREEVDELIAKFDKTVDSRTERRTELQGDGSLIARWSSKPERYEELSEELQGYEDFAESSIQTFIKHPNLAAPPIWLQEDGGIKYRVKHPRKDISAFIIDYRFTELFDYKVVIEHPNGGHEEATVSKTGFIIEYSNNAGRLGSEMRFNAMLDWIVPKKSKVVDLPPSLRVRRNDKHSDLSEPDLEMIRDSTDIDESKVMTGVVDRISNSGNPIVEVTEGNFVLDRGEPGDKCVFEILSSNRARVLSRDKAGNSTD